MSKPQKENGYTPIANEILDQIVRIKLNGTQFRILLAVWRYTYGFSRKQHSLSETFLSKAIGIATPHISREMKPLYENKILIKIEEAAFNKAAVIMFNKNYQEWQLLSNTVGVTELGNTTVTELGNKSITENGNQDKQNIKQKENKGDFDYFFESVWKLYPHKKGKQAVSVKTKKELYKHNYEIIAKSIENYKQQKPDWQNYMDGSTFFNGRWKEFAEPEQNESSAVDEKPKGRNY